MPSVGGKPLSYLSIAWLGIFVKYFTLDSLKSALLGTAFIVQCPTIVNSESGKEMKESSRGYRS